MIFTAEQMEQLVLHGIKEIVLRYPCDERLSITNMGRQKDGDYFVNFYVKAAPVKP